MRRTIPARGGRAGPAVACALTLFLAVPAAALAEAIEVDFEHAGKLANGRVNLIVGDPAVIRFSVANTDIAEDQRDQILGTLTPETPILQYNHLYYAVSKEREGWQETLSDLNEAIAAFHDEGTTVDVIRRSNRECGLAMDATLAPYIEQ